MTNANLTELDARIESLQGELAACPNRLWTSKKNQFRLALLVELVAKRAALAA